ncbi:MAG: 2'-5' RNA ligase family protein [Actinomycetota bacterium]|nr:2'-5' RNA ligase family protein [Actinomycetota bacterium]
MSAARVAVDSDPDSDPQVMGVSIPVPAPWGEHLQAKRASYGDPLANLVPTHVTLLGPTAVSARDVDDLVAHLLTVAATTTPFSMVLRGTGTFRPVSDVVFVQVARGIAGCEQLQRAIATPRWVGEPTYPYHPHVTVAHDVDEQALDRAFDDLGDWSAAFEVTSFHLYARAADGTWTSRREFGLSEVSVQEVGTPR